MFFSEEEMRIAEDLAWKMLDGWNHAYMPDLEDYAYFYYKGQIIMDPWMNEKSQGLPWPDHVSKESAVAPVEYYGQKTIEDYLVHLFLLRPEWDEQITEKIKSNITDRGLLKRTSTIMPIEVYIAMSERQAEEEHGSTCIEWELPDSRRIYFEMEKLPEKLITVVSKGWQKEIIFQKKDAKKILQLLYPEGITFDYQRLLNRIQGNEVRLIGFGD